ncbi:uncharacterized protein BDCG_06567 [Blastomyces dermatitidis ER-3]|uniref:Uncharacterized protein n=1 Tax=Ajellomyces dermatitidis (strain ER-3 / ATCC MYA-2586) TaxID=559297 RepID=A0ABP2F5G1_AJEDR|nr:uncharacterized protein BDCG_06567 [Blastomyces dermatitidis ER-3]EEQ91447.2 hypothetical protein BDCG_06567 [Blastomyces dermatitidis ER-3]
MPLAIRFSSIGATMHSSTGPFSAALLQPGWTAVSPYVCRMTTSPGYGGRALGRRVVGDCRRWTEISASILSASCSAAGISSGYSISSTSVMWLSLRNSILSQSLMEYSETLEITEMAIIADHTTCGDLTVMDWLEFPQSETADAYFTVIDSSSRLLQRPSGDKNETRRRLIGKT